MSEESIENITTSNSFFAPFFLNHYILPDINLNGHSLLNNNISIPEKVMNIFISYILNQWHRYLNTDFALGNCLFAFSKLTKNADPDKYVYTGYGIRFNLSSESSLLDGSVGKNVIIFGADMSSSVHIDNNGTDILILGEVQTQGLDDQQHRQNIPLILHNYKKDLY